MTWFVAGIVSYFEVIGESQSEFPMYEDFYLFEANTQDELNSKIKQSMQITDSAGASGITISGKPAIQKCAGVRKIRSVYNEPPLDIEQDQPSDGTALTHSFFIAKSFEDVKRYAQGKAVSLLCVDDDDLDETR
jgi:hypothetical protein